MNLWRHFRLDMATASDDVCTVHKHTKNPEYVWSKMRASSICNVIKPLEHIKTPVTDDKVRFVCISDTHTQLEKKKTLDFIPNGDVLLHAGDITNFGSPEEVYNFNEFVGKLPHRHKIVIAGNHDVTFDETMLSMSRNAERVRMLKSLLPKYSEFLERLEVKNIRDLLTGCTYLQDSSVALYSIKIHGSPWTPEFHWWGFNAERGRDCLDKWNLIPTDTDIVITHGPPIGHGDRVFDKRHVGCVELLTSIQKRIKPAYHVFGHIHEGYGMTTDGVTTYINASTCNLFYRPDNPPIVFDYQLPPGVLKSQFVKPTHS